MDPALMAQIQAGRMLKKTVTVDKSRPYFGGAQQSQPAAGGPMGGMFPIPVKKPAAVAPPAAKAPMAPPKKEETPVSAPKQESEQKPPPKISNIPAPPPPPPLSAQPAGKPIAPPPPLIQAPPPPQPLPQTSNSKPALPPPPPMGALAAPPPAPPAPSAPLPPPPPASVDLSLSALRQPVESSQPSALSGRQQQTEEQQAPNAVPQEASAPKQKPPVPPRPGQQKLAYQKPRFRPIATPDLPIVTQVNRTVKRIDAEPTCWVGYRLTSLLEDISVALLELQ